MKLSFVLIPAIAAVAFANPVAQKEPADPCDKCDKKFLACKNVSIIFILSYIKLSVPLVMGLLAKSAPVRLHVRLRSRQIRGRKWKRDMIVT
jgi:hypothetical protein